MATTRLSGDVLREYDRQIQSIVYKVIKNPNDREDAAQEVRIAVWKGLEKYNGTAKLSTYITRIAINTCINILRKDSRCITYEPEDVFDLEEQGRIDEAVDCSPEDKLLEVELMNRLYIQLERTEQMVQDIFALKYEECMELQDIAKTLNTPIGTVKSKLHRAIQALRADLA